jgi:hypothetical protein
VEIQSELLVPIRFEFVLLPICSDPINIKEKKKKRTATAWTPDPRPPLSLSVLAIGDRSLIPIASWLVDRSESKQKKNRTCSAARPARDGRGSLASSEHRPRPCPVGTPALASWAGPAGRSRTRSRRPRSTRQPRFEPLACSLDHRRSLWSGARMLLSFCFFS